MQVRQLQIVNRLGLLAASMGARVSIETSGPDEVEAMAAVTRLISNGFGEN